MIDPRTITSAVRKAADALIDSDSMPASIVDAYVARHEFELELITKLRGTHIDLWDLGGGLGLFAAAAAVLGMRATLVDDFVDVEKRGEASRLFAALEGLGVTVVRHDFHSGPLPLTEGIDVVTSFHTIEHLHHSPRQEYHRVVDAISPGGFFILAGPNAVNLRKRLTAPLGKVEWSSMRDWYYEPVFRGHVREPRAQDLVEIARDLGLESRLLGRNFIGSGRGGLAGFAARFSEPLLEKYPALCSDLYLVARKP